jgi:HPt (histidine-containing phosphotransfer) domain-containing protein
MKPPAEARPAIDELRLIGGDELVREMAGTFSRFAESQVDRLDEASGAGELELVAALAHALHASSRQMGVAALAEAAASAEVASRGRDAAAVEQAVDRSRRALNDARAWLDGLAQP